jgi:hypothetical protein
MLHSIQLRNKTINLRKSGLSYTEIHKLTRVPKSTLSDWLKSYKLTQQQNLRFRKLNLKNLKLASLSHQKHRLKKTDKIISQAQKQIGNLSNTDLWNIGIILYWAEGSKQKEHAPSKGVIFSNSDPLMIKLFLRWLKESVKIKKEQIVFEIYIHTTYQKTLPELSSYWSKITGFPIEKFQKVYFKKNKVHSYRKNKGPNYNGVLRISVKKSTDLNRQITGWIQGICKQFLV